MKKKKKKKLNKLSFKMQYIYIGIILIVLSMGIAYGLRFFIHRQNGLSGNLTSSLVSIEASENGVINMEGAVPMKDQAGLLGNGKTLTITNTSATDLLLKLTVTEGNDSTIPTESIRYGLYLNTRLKNIIRW